MISSSLKIPHAVLKAGGRTPDEQIVVGMMPTVARRLADLPKFQWVISDECHLAMSPTWSAVLVHYGDAWHLGQSATPCRLDGRPLGEAYQQIVYGPSVKELTARGFLSPCRVFAPPQKLEPIKKSGSDFNLDAAAEQLDTRAITGSAVQHLRRLGPDRRAIVFTCNRAHCEHVAEEFRQGGFSAISVDGSMPDRKQRIKAHRNGEFQVLVNVELCATGYDDPKLEAGIFLRPTDSLALYLQMVGRILRVADGKRDALLLDHVGAVLMHGMPDDDREWTLEGRPKKQAIPAVRQCPECYACHAPAPRCPQCQHVYVAAKPRRVAPDRVDGELGEVTAEQVKARRAAELKAQIAAAWRQPTDAEARAALQVIARERGYKPGFVWQQMQLRAQIRGRRAA